MGLQMIQNKTNSEFRILVLITRPASCDLDDESILLDDVSFVSSIELGTGPR